MGVTNNEFQMLIQRFDAQDDAIKDIKDTLTPIVTKVERHDTIFKTMGWVLGITVPASISAWLKWR